MIIAARKTLLEARKDLWLTQEELANKVNISRAYYSNLEAGKYTPSLKTANNLARALGRSVEDLFL